MHPNFTSEILEIIINGHSVYIADKMSIYSARLPENLEKYVKILISKGYARNPSNAINLIILERMLNDKEKGEISPFSHIIEDGRRSPPRDDILLSEISTDNISAVKKEDEPNAPLGDASHTRGPDPDRSAEIKTSSGRSPFKTPVKPTYPGTRAQYLEDLRKGLIIEGMFNPPEA